RPHPRHLHLRAFSCQRTRRHDWHWNVPSMLSMSVFLQLTGQHHSCSERVRSQCCSPASNAETGDYSGVDIDVASPRGRLCSAKEPSRMSTEERIIRLLNITSGYYKFWTDSRLAWNETDDPKLAKFEKIFLPTDYVDVKSFETNKFLVDVSSNGRMKLETPLGITIKCPLKMRDFPFDTQRRPLYYVIVLIIPSALILATCIFGFLLPADSGDRLALNVAILLSMSVFLQLAGSITPAQSESVPVLTWYFTVAMAVTALSTIGSIVVHLCYRRAAIAGGCEQPGAEAAVPQPPVRLNYRVSSATSKAAAASSSSSSLASVQDGCRDPGDEWLHVSCVLDRLMLVCVVSLSVAVTVLGATANKSN
uniref:Neur_chan_LBD domain-containing protein n=1 Tax=Macrostomum lignano TaxID=282301 RepID=A0A1I8FN00_9PLAT